MDIIDEVTQFKSVTGGVCTVKKWLDANPDYSNEDLQRASEKLGNTALWKFMKSKGFTKSLSPVQRHLAGVCACP